MTLPRELNRKVRRAHLIAEATRKTSDTAVMDMLTKDEKMFTLSI